MTQLTNSTDAPIEADVVIIGAGPCGLFQIFELGLLGIRAHIIETLEKPGGQCSELYPDKPIYDIPAVPIIGAQALIDNLMVQTKPFEPTFHFAQQVIHLEQLDADYFYVETNTGTRFHTRAVVVAGGVGSFEPVRLKVPRVENHIGSQVFYAVKDARRFEGRDIVILGGGDSALDWAFSLRKSANSVLLIHRSEEFKAAPSSVQQLRRYCDELDMQFLSGNVTALIESESRLTGVEVLSLDGVRRRIETDDLLVFFGLSPKLGPIGDFQVDFHKNKIKVDTERFQSSLTGLFAVGDINWYPGKKKLILSGFHEAALAAFAIKERLNPGRKVSLQYTTTSSVMHERLGVDNPYSNEEAAA